MRRYEEGTTPIPIHLLVEFSEYYNIFLSDLLDFKKSEKVHDNRILLEKNIFQIKKIYESKNNKEIKITNAAVDFLSKIIDVI